jgi:hypothetical protein
MSEFTNELELFIGSKEYTVNTAPVGLLLLENGSIICKSEYYTNDTPDCIIIESGENYCGGDLPCKSLIIQ